LALSVLTIGDAIALVVASLARIEMLLFIAGAGALVLFFVNNAFIIRGLVRRSVASGLFAIEVLSLSVALNVGSVRSHEPIVGAIGVIQAMLTIYLLLTLSKKVRTSDGSV
jgi:hypothetical protein